MNLMPYLSNFGKSYRGSVLCASFPFLLKRSGRVRVVGEWILIVVFLEESLMYPGIYMYIYLL